VAIFDRDALEYSRQTEFSRCGWNLFLEMFIVIINNYYTLVLICSIFVEMIMVWGNFIKTFISKDWLAHKFLNMWKHFSLKA